jgi:ABC-type Fe3+-citrate transport system substrate-binding protein
MKWPHEWQMVPAVRDGRVFALDANAYVSRPAGRLVTGIEAMAQGLHPEMKVREKAKAAIMTVGEPRRLAHRAGAES